MTLVHRSNVQTSLIIIRISASWPSKPEFRPPMGARGWSSLAILIRWRNSWRAPSQTTLRCGSEPDSSSSLPLFWPQLSRKSLLMTWLSTPMIILLLVGRIGVGVAISTSLRQTRFLDPLAAVFQWHPQNGLLYRYTIDQLLSKATLDWSLTSL